MKLVELVGKQAIRTAPIVQKQYASMRFGAFGGGYEDVKNYLYTASPVFVAAATDTHAIIVRAGYSKDYMAEVIGEEFNDDNWTEYDDLEKQACEMIKNKFPDKEIEVPNVSGAAVADAVNSLKDTDALEK